MSEDESAYSPERKMEEAESRLAGIARDLGFFPTSEMESLAAGINPENLKDSISGWKAKAEQVPEQYHGKQWHAAQVGALVAEAVLVLQGRDMPEFRSAMDDAITYADQVGLAEVAVSLIEIRKSLGN